MTEHEIPKIIFYQALNFFGLAAILFFVLRPKVSTFFSNRHDQLTLALREAKKLKDEAKAKHDEYSSKLKNLETESAKILNQIRHEGEETKRRMVEEGRRLAETIQAEAKRTAEIEIEKARTELYDEVLTQALSGARSILTKSVAEKDQLRLQKEFVEKIEAVQ